MQTSLTRSTDSFLWGVATSGYQSEGGYNGPGQPQNNWAPSEAKHDVMRTGSATEFWTRYEEDFQRCQDMGLNSFRLGLEWARIQPSTDRQPGSPPAFDYDALDAYADRLAACRRHGLEPVVTLHHFTHPAWLGLDAWLSEQVVEPFVEYVRVSVTHINRRLVDYYHLPPIHWYITINEPNILVSNTYLNKQFPAGGAVGSGAALQAYNHLLAAHVRAYNCIHDTYEAEGWTTPRVSLNTYCSDLYWSEKVIWDLLDLRRHNLKPREVKDYIDNKASQLEAALRQANLSFRRDLPYQLGRLTHWTTNRLGYRLFHIEQLALFMQELERSPRPQVMDYLAIDYYDPFIAHIFRLPSFSDFEFKTKGFRAWVMSGITSKWWDWRSLPEGLHFFCQYYSQDLGNRPIMIAENGMALRRKLDNSVATHRADQLRRSEFLKAHIDQIKRLLQESVPVLGYMHWSLTDNYEWGSYTPRFGLFSLNFEAGSDRLIEDHLGDRPSETYARLVREVSAELAQSTTP
ncbi:glycoside hydrolase family 1 protein [Oculatella sp. LEGE 06141]|uniref:glycoside hydrolase family 1 protein n=1 Tax=Oculatella sp. LEGE 06141 TaxID=1828648 RepID=UPI0018827E7E|nr:family 1 glycosylhydrolase [Oculatella sp. LEGE 06141]MBE9178361.1 glycoside hydrolase family 1 protein [Oculatella sp. LEGE 06141]